MSRVELRTRSLFLGVEGGVMDLVSERIGVYVTLPNCLRYLAQKKGKNDGRTVVEPVGNHDA